MYFNLTQRIQHSKEIDKINLAVYNKILRNKMGTDKYKTKEMWFKLTSVSKVSKQHSDV